MLWLLYKQLLNKMGCFKFQYVVTLLGLTWMILCRIPISQRAYLVRLLLLHEPEQGADGGILVRQCGRFLRLTSLEQFDDHLKRWTDYR